MVTLQTDGKEGLIRKTVQVVTNDPVKELVVLKLKARVVDNFHKDKSRPDAIFRSPCRRCHIDRGIGKLGGELFRADCLVCHKMGGSAKPLSLLRKLPKGRLRKAIERGVPETVMPGFSWRFGGPLTVTQIRSLDKYVKGE